ncbi:MAG: type II toxin-antitoxin system RelE/ParE family toxin [Planctomycetota bacterium]
MSDAKPAYRVRFTKAARRDLNEHALFIAVQEHHPDPGLDWHAKAYDEALKLDFMPSRCVLATGYESLPYPIRRLVHHNHLILFTIDEEAKTVYVLAIVHGARLPRPGELHPSIDRVRRDTGE